MSEPLVGEGCDFFPDGIWKTCCDAHDIAFNQMGSIKDFVNANSDLASCVAGYNQGWGVAGVMFVGVMVGGFFVYPFKMFGGLSLYQHLTGKKY